MKKMNMAVAVAGLAMVASAGSVFDDMAHRIEFLGDLNGNGQIDANEACDILTYSSANPIGAIAPQMATGNVGFESCSIQSSIFPWTTLSACGVNFPQPVDPDDAGKTHGCCITFKNCAVGGKAHTTYVRFRWDGALTDAMDTDSVIFGNGVNTKNPYADPDKVAKGYSIRIRATSGNPNTGRMRFLGRYSDGDIGWGDNAAFTITAGVWYDLFIQGTEFDASSGSQTLMSWIATAPAQVTDDAGVKQYPETVFAEGRKWDGVHIKGSESYTDVTIGAMMDNKSTASFSDLCKAGTDARVYPFKGTVERLCSWTRALTEAERWQVISQMPGGKFVVGVKNGKADEFGAETDAESVYEPLTMPWRKMRRELTAEHPTLTLKYPATNCDKGMDQILTVETANQIVGNGMVAVMVNGVNLGVFDFNQESERAVYLKSKKLTPDKDGFITISLTRTGSISGAMEIDQISLTGGWRMGAEDWSFNGFSRDGYVSTRYHLGDADISHISRGIHSAKVLPNHLYFAFYVPESALKYTTYTWRTRTLSSGVGDTPHHNFSFKVNGVEVESVSGVAQKAILEFDIPSERLVSGINVMDIDDSNQSGSTWMTFDSHALSITNLRKSGLFLVVK